jgi:hypothetical protein
MRRWIKSSPGKPQIRAHRRLGIWEKTLLGSLDTAKKRERDKDILFLKPVNSIGRDQIPEIRADGPPRLRGSMSTVNVTAEGRAEKSTPAAPILSTR